MKPSSGPSTDYHDYVFKDGRLIGDFNGMYKNSKEVPWHQDRMSSSWESVIGLELLAGRTEIRTALEAGCGLGYYANEVKRRLPQNATMWACDVSDEAIRRASKLFPEIDFFVADLSAPELRCDNRFDLVACSNIFWYLTEKLAVVADNLRKLTSPKGYLFIQQTFPRLDRPFHGDAVLPNPEALLNVFSSWNRIASAVVFNHEKPGDGPILHALLRRPD